jgi:alkanesulfonate monooxygenase SsuD/methylene tetrahydromethanopterin reductase-like flavin-dependent oxidoreductase (luciferase family)
MGFGAIWSAETRHDPFLRLAVASTTTARVGLGTAIAVEELVPRLHAKSPAGDWEGMADLISDETLDHFAVSGSFATIGERIRERYRGLYDRTQLYPSFQPSLDDPRWPAVLAGFQGARGAMLQSDRERRSVWRS